MREAIIDLPCRVKHELAPGDLRAGSRTLVYLLHAREKIEFHRARPRQDGKPVDEIVLRVPLQTAEGEREQTATLGEFESDTARLTTLVPICTNCPANVLLRPFGCIGGLPFPIPKVVELYALERVAPPDRVGGALLLETLHADKVNGEIAREHRLNSHFEAMSASIKNLPANTFDKATLSTDELFEPLFVRGSLEAHKILNVLLWFEAVTLGDRLPPTVNDVLELTRLDPSERPKRTKFRPGLPATDPRADHFRGFLKLLYVGWANDLAIDLEC